MRWNPTVHAVKRLKERMGIEPESAKNYVNQLMQAAKYVTTQADGQTVYHHAEKNVMIVVNIAKNSVITLFSDTWTEDGTPVKTEEKPSALAESTPKLTVDRIADAVKREYKRMRTEVTREINRMKEEYAATGVKIAELKWKQVRCKAPHTKALIQSRIDELVAVTRQITTEIDAKLTQMDAAEAEVKAVVGE